MLDTQDMHEEYRQIAVNFLRENETLPLIRDDISSSDDTIRTSAPPSSGDWSPASYYPSPSSSPSPSEKQFAVFRDFLDRDMYGTWREYCEYISRPGTWGDHLCLLALANALSVRIVIVSSVDIHGDASPVTVIEPLVKKSEMKSIFLSHWAEYHYGSLKQESAEGEA
tara:strand:- start:190 stop:693 length:504 start_codon:yes stop_codon:yes gene_type:complete